MAEKTGAGGKSQEYDEENGQYGSNTSGEKLSDAIKQYSDDPAHDLAAEGLPGGKKSAPERNEKQKRKIQSQVFEKISIVRKRLETHGRAMVTVFDDRCRYRVLLYGPDKDYEYEIIDVEEIE